jgi:hypothetical protein
MKTACLTLVMIGCAVFIHGTSYAFSPNSAPQEQSSESSTKRAAAHDGKGQNDGTPPYEQRTRRHISATNHLRNRVGLNKPNHPLQLRMGRERSTPGNVMNVRQPSPGKSATGAAKIANRSSLSVRTASVAALNGTQFKDSHNRGLAPAIIGRTANVTKGTAAINGTAINRRRVN